MTSSDKCGNVTRRQLIRAGGAVSLSAAALGVGRTAATAAPRHQKAAAEVIFDPKTPGKALITNKELSMVRTAMQSFVIDTVAGHIYVLQLVQANTTLPGDEDGDETYERRAVRGDLALTQLDLDGKRLGRMYLKFFGHGVAMGLERDGDDIWLWTEIDSVPKESDGQGRGCRLTRFQFEDGKLLDAEHDDSLWRRELIPGSTQNTCSIDPVNNKLAMRYWADGGSFRLALYDLDEVKKEKASYTAIFDIATPSEVSKNLFQGYATLGDYLYHVDGSAYSDSNPGPPDGKGNVHLARIRWSTDKIDVLADETTGLEMYRREPEALSVVLAHPDDTGKPDQLRLYSGFATSADADPSADRLCSIFYRQGIAA